MNPRRALGLVFDGERLTVLDQRRLPTEERWLPAETPEAMREHIHCLAVRGAPLIGVAAALSLGHYARGGPRPEAFRAAAARLRSARPTAVNLMHAVDRMLRAFGDGDTEAAGREAEAIFDEDVALCEAMARHGAALLGDGDGVLTHCNSGALATAGVGTALGVVRRAWEDGKRLHVYVDETRPLLQGARLTAWELRRLGIPYTLQTDGMAALLLRAGRVKRVLVGADRVARNGDFANKVGTYGLAVQCAHHGVPFHPVAPWSTVDLAVPSGEHIPIEDRAPDEVRGASGAFGTVRWAPEDAAVFNPSFDVTPASLVTSLVLDRGVYSREALLAGVLGTLGG
ncbi:MAG: S-methyl-5-thioribose-1-phosphate isomerase [Deltaproteobacteria bacterium]|nr:S-methyl-5-thioribose-1-phosphate isomerase [Deltaproteobacteria bacterium]